MATTSISVRATIPFPPVSVTQISQAQLGRVLELRCQIEALESSLDASESEIKSALECGAHVESGTFRASLQVTERRNVSWKSIVEREMGDDYAARVLRSTKADKYTSLTVSA